MWLDLIASMRGHGRLRSPFQERLFLIIGQACRVIEQCVISGRHRTSTNGVFDTLQRCRSLLRIVSLPIGKIQHPRAELAARYVGETDAYHGALPAVEWHS